MDNKKTGCAYVDCKKHADPDCDNGLCFDHSSEWRMSSEFTAALRDPDVGMHIYFKRLYKAMSIVNEKYKAKWLKRMAAG